jgi:hypothetical protein
LVIASAVLICCLVISARSAATDDASAPSRQDQRDVPHSRTESHLLFEAIDFETGKFGYVDQRGVLSIPFQFDLATPFGDDGFAATYMGAPFEGPYRAAIINRKGERVFSGGHAIQPIGRGRFAVSEKDGVRFVSFFEPFAVALKCTDLRWGPSEGMLAVGVDGKWGFIDDKGDVAIPPKFNGVRPFAEGLAPASTGDGWGYIDHAGNWVIRPQFEQAYGFNDGRAGVSHEGRGWYIDRTGKRVSEGDYKDVQNFSEGLGCFLDAKSNLWGYVDTSGKVVIPATLQSARPFSEGLAFARDRHSQGGFIDHTGKFVIKPSKNPLVSVDFSNGRALIHNDDRVGYIDRRGDWIWASPPVPDDQKQ